MILLSLSPLLPPPEHVAPHNGGQLSHPRLAGGDRLGVVVEHLLDQGKPALVLDQAAVLPRIDLDMKRMGGLAQTTNVKNRNARNRHKKSKKSGSYAIPL